VAGEYTADAVPSCQPCVAGKWSLAGVQTSRTDCGIGKASAVPGVSSNATCIDCVAGRYATAAGASNCTECANGKYANCDSTRLSDETVGEPMRRCAQTRLRSPSCYATAPKKRARKGT
jgi:hypothetical protein